MWNHADQSLYAFKRLESCLDETKARSSDNIVMSYFHRTRLECQIEIFYTTGRHKKLTASVLMDFVLIATLCSK